MCNKADCINWDSDMWGGHCMCVEPPCLPKKRTFTLTKVYKNGERQTYGTLELEYNTLEQIEDRFTEFVNEYGNEDDKIDYWELKKINGGFKRKVHAPRYTSIGKSSPQRADG